MAEYVFRVDESRADIMGNMPCERRERIVRCRDCVHWRRLNDHERSRCTGAMAFVEPDPDGFCAWGRLIVGEDS